MEQAQPKEEITKTTVEMALHSLKTTKTKVKGTKTKPKTA
jgi:hypothetical protein